MSPVRSHISHLTDLWPHRDKQQQQQQLILVAKSLSQFS